MRKNVKISLYIFVFLTIPFVIIFSISSNVRRNLNKPVFYNKKGNCESNCKNLVSKVVYAKVKANCYLFKTSDVTDASYRNVEFIIPETYFVKVLDDVNSFVKKVQYNNKIGYVSADSIYVVDFVPVFPTLEGVYFDIPDDVGTHLRKQPVAEDLSNVIMVIPAGTKSVSYVASIIGTIPTGGSSNIWYYVTYSPISDPTSVYEGYVYSLKTINISKIVENVEGKKEVESEEMFDSEKGFDLNPSVKNVLIFVICIPIILVFILLLVNNKKVKNENNKIEISDSEFVDKNKSLSKINAGVDKKFSKIEDLKDKSLSKKGKFYAKFIEEDFKDEGEFKVSFPSYEMVDEDDLL